MDQSRTTPSHFQIQPPILPPSPLPPSRPLPFINNTGISRSRHHPPLHVELPQRVVNVGVVDVRWSVRVYADAPDVSRLGGGGGGEGGKRDAAVERGGASGRTKAFSSSSGNSRDTTTRAPCPRQGSSGCGAQAKGTPGHAPRERSGGVAVEGVRVGVAVVVAVAVAVAVVEAGTVVVGGCSARHEREALGVVVQ